MHKMVVFAKAADGRAEELGRWYDERHFPDLLAVPGFVSAERHTLITVKQPDGLPGWDFMLIYEIQGDPMPVLHGMGALMGTDKLPFTDALVSMSTLSVVGLSQSLQRN